MAVACPHANNLSSQPFTVKSTTISLRPLCTKRHSATISSPKAADRKRFMFHCTPTASICAFTTKAKATSATVGEDCLNFHDIAHGALVFAVADVAFAFVVNAQIDAVGVQWNMNLFRSAALGDEIVAECRLVHKGRRLMVVDFTVKGCEERLLACGQATAMPVQSQV